MIATTLEYQMELSATYESTPIQMTHVVEIQEHTPIKLTFSESLLDSPCFSESAAIRLPQSNQWELAEKWKGDIRKRFDELSIKEAIDEATEEELLELEQIAARRRILLNPRSAVEIEIDIKNERALRKVIQGLSEYVRPI